MEDKKTIKSRFSKFSPLVDEDLDTEQSEIDEEAVNVVRKEKILMRKLLQGLKRFWVWIVVLALVGVIGGTIYSKSIRTYYTTTLRVMFAAEAKEEGGSPYSYNITQQLKETMQDFIKTNVVLDRANYYYDQFGKQDYKDVTVNGMVYKAVDQFLDDCKAGKFDFNTIKGTDAVSKIERQIFADKIAVESSKDEDLFVMYIKYSGYAEDDTESKVEIIRYAAEEEALEVDETSENVYFGAYIRLRDLGQDGTAVVSASSTKSIVLGAVVGVVIAAALIILICILDSRVKDKEEIELITGTNLIAYIDLQGEE